MKKELLRSRPRLEALRRQLVDDIPCDPPTEELTAQLRSLTLDRVLFTWVEWVQRFVRPAPRWVTHREGFWDQRAEKHRTEIEALISQIMFGADLTPHLSDRVRKHGYAPRGSDGRKVRGIDWQRMDFVINAYGVHHLHLRASGSDELLFVQFGREGAALLLLGTHKSFFNGEAEDAVTRWRAESGEWELRGISALERDMDPKERTQAAVRGLSTMARVGDKFVISAMTSTAGTSINGVRHADRIALTLENDEPRLDDGALTDIIPSEHLVALKGRRWRWAMNYCDLVLVEETSKRGFIRVIGPN